MDLPLGYKGVATFSLGQLRVNYSILPALAIDGDLLLPIDGRPCI
jgi:hypothetical protein